MLLMQLWGLLSSLYPGRSRGGPDKYTSFETISSGSKMGEKNMERLEELIRILSEPAIRSRHSKAKTTQTCKICGGSALRFRDAVSSFEYTVSAICQECQDKYLYAEDRRAS
jgi:hypothetical protein